MTLGSQRERLESGLESVRQLAEMHARSADAGPLGVRG
jgi:hypothetical protein